MSARAGGLMGSWARRAVESRLATLETGRLDVVEGGRRNRFGGSGGEPSAAIEVHDPRFYRRLAAGGSIGAAESYVDGEWDCDDLVALVRILALNRHLNEGVETGLAAATAPLRRLFHWLRRNTRRGSRRNIGAHYDLGNDFFEIMLDGTLSYSCAVFPREDSSLLEASNHKLDLICGKLELAAGDRLVEIGTGWGGLAIHAARHYGCRVSTTTISQQQYELATERIRQAGLDDRIEVVQLDYRDLVGHWGKARFDKLVSVEMIEAVGERFLGDYFAACSELLEPDGLMLLQAIVMADRYYDSYRGSVDFIQRYIFPGSLLPSIGSMAEAVAQRTDLTLTHLQDLTPHYARTLRQWRHNVDSNRERLHGLGYDERFLRLWRFYLCYCEGGFMERVIGDVQTLYGKPLNRREPLSPAFGAGAELARAALRTHQLTEVL